MATRSELDSVFTQERTRFIYETRMAFAFSRPALIEKPRGDHDRAMEAHWLEMARRCNRPHYLEPEGFTPDRWMLAGNKTYGRSICGHEKAYGWGRTFWKYVWLAVKAAWWSGWNDAVGTTYKTTPPGRRNDFAVITGITA